MVMVRLKLVFAVGQMKKKEWWMVAEHQMQELQYSVQNQS